MKKKFKIIDASSGEKLKLGGAQAIPPSYRFLDLL